MHVLAIDQGTSSTKAVVLSRGGEEIAAASAPVSPRACDDGAVLQDPIQLLDSIVRAGCDAVAAAGRAGVAPGEIAAVGLGNQGETVLAWDRRTGAPLSDAVSWQDRRAERVTSALSEHGDRLTELTGLPLDPYFAAPKMTLLARERAARGERPVGAEGCVISTIDAWVNARLAGAYVTDAATASRTLALDIAGGDWSAEACELFELDPTELPRVLSNAEVIGETEAFGPTLAVSAVVVDQQAALLGQSCLRPGEAKCTYGTGAFILANAGQAVPRSPGGLAVCIAWRVGDQLTYCLDGQVYSAASAVTWLTELGLLREPRELDNRAGMPPPPVSGPLFVPALAGLGSPHWAPSARGAWTGLSLATSAADLVDAVVWGIAAHVALLGREIEQDIGRPLQGLRVDGGLSRSMRLLQAQADLLQIPVARAASTDATSRGIGALAALGAGAASELADAVGPWVSSAVLEPAMSEDEAQNRLAVHEAAIADAIAIARVPIDGARR